MYQELWKAYQGKNIWHHLRRCYGEQHYLFFLAGQEEYSRYGMELLPAYMKYNRLNHVVIVTDDTHVDKPLGNCDMVRITTIQMKCLMRYYALSDVSEYWTVLSTTYPYDTGAERLLGIQGVILRDIVYHDVYRLDGSVQDECNA